MSNPYIPDQLHHMSKKELLEFARTAHEENVKLSAELKREGVGLRARLCAALGRNAECNETIENMQKKLAKANERVEKYKNAIDEECILWDFTVDEENPRKSIKQLLDITDAVAREPDVNNMARKFAIEQRIEGARCYARLLHSVGLSGVWDLFDSISEQLRKEKEK